MNNSCVSSVIEFGNFTVVSDVQSANIIFPNDSTESGMLMLVNEAHPQKAPSPMLWTVLGIVTVFNNVQFKNPLADIAVTVFPLISSGIVAFVRSLLVAYTVNVPSPFSSKLISLLYTVASTLFEHNISMKIILKSIIILYKILFFIFSSRC